MGTQRRTNQAATGNAEPIRSQPTFSAQPSGLPDRLETIKQLLTCQCPRCAGDGWVGPDFLTPVEERVTCTLCSGQGWIEDDVHDNHLAWCIGEIERLRARDAAWQAQTGRDDP